MERASHSVPRLAKSTSGSCLDETFATVLSKTDQRSLDLMAYLARCPSCQGGPLNPEKENLRPFSEAVHLQLVALAGITVVGCHKVGVCFESL